jgi:hypothetical protein
VTLLAVAGELETAVWHDTSPTPASVGRLSLAQLAAGDVEAALDTVRRGATRGVFPHAGRATEVLMSAATSVLGTSARDTAVELCALAAEHPGAAVGKVFGIETFLHS